MTDEQEITSRIEWIEKNLHTQDTWEREDFSEFYERDVRFLLAELRRLEQDNRRQRAALEEIAERAHRCAAA